MNIARYERPAADYAFVGTWHIYGIEMWDASYLNTQVQAYVEVRPDNMGTFQFGLVSGGLDGYVETDSDTERFVFTWEGSDEMNPMTGSGWLVQRGKDDVGGLIAFHLGDRSRFRARRAC